MRRFLVLVVLGVAPAIATGVLQAVGEPPAWAYAIPVARPAGAPAAPAAAPDTSIKQLPGSTLTFTRQQIADGFGPADWFPGDHPKMPDIVAHARASGRLRAASVTTRTGRAVRRMRVFQGCPSPTSSSR